MDHHIIRQGTPEWFAQRCGKATASRVADIIARTKTGWGASRANYAAQLVAERLTGIVEESFQSSAMKWGTDIEPEARDAYRFYRGVDVVEASFVEHPEISFSGASPDGLVDDGVVEIKCPNTATHIATLLGQSLPGKYLAQIQWQLACTGRNGATSDLMIRGYLKECACLSCGFIGTTKELMSLEHRVVKCEAYPAVVK